MKKHLSLILVLLPAFFLALPAMAQQRKKVGVVLSGGGAKGVAHIQALKVIEEAGIPIDYIVGTSMGSIIGGLYSIGYTPHQLDSMVRKQDWMFLLSKICLFIPLYQKPQRRRFRWNHKGTESGQPIYGTDSRLS